MVGISGMMNNFVDILFVYDFMWCFFLEVCYGYEIGIVEDDVFMDIKIYDW